MDAVSRQLAEVQRRYPEAHFDRAPDGQAILIVPGIPTVEGWSSDAVTLRVLVPTGYPHVNPDCFYTDPGLTLASGGEPANSGVQPVFGSQYRWFSWHVAAWDANTGSLDKYVRSCEQRLKDLQ
jgi:hypothetical protein